MEISSSGIDVESWENDAAAFRNDGNCRVGPDLLSVNSLTATEVKIVPVKSQGKRPRTSTELDS
jgi:hypothetical protein